MPFRVVFIFKIALLSKKNTCRSLAESLSIALTSFVSWGSPKPLGTTRDGLTATIAKSDRPSLSRTTAFCTTNDTAADSYTFGLPLQWSFSPALSCHAGTQHPRAPASSSPRRPKPERRTCDALEDCVQRRTHGRMRWIACRVREEIFRHARTHSPRE